MSSFLAYTTQEVDGRKYIYWNGNKYLRASYQPKKYHKYYCCKELCNAAIHLQKEQIIDFKYHSVGRKHNHSNNSNVDAQFAKDKAVHHMKLEAKYGKNRRESWNNFALSHPQTASHLFFNQLRHRLRANDQLPRDKPGTIEQIDDCLQREAKIGWDKNYWCQQNMKYKKILSEQNENVQLFFRNATPQEIETELIKKKKELGNLLEFFVICFSFCVILKNLSEIVYNFVKLFTIF